MRTLFIALTALTLVTPPSAQAQSRRGAARGTTPPPAPAQGAPPPIVYPFPPLMTPPTGGLTPRIPENPRFRTPARQSRRPFAGAFYGPYLGYGEPVAPGAPMSEAPEARASGWLRLAVIPTHAQVFVDEYYVGTVADVNAKRELQLDAGPHRIRFIAPQFQTVAVDVQISPNDTVTYRGTLEPTRPIATPTPQRAGTPTPMYVIANCYIGNVPPRASRLPSGCDIKQVRVLDQK